MAKRMDAVWRVIAFLWAIVAAFVAQFVAIVALVWGVIDILWQFTLGSEGLSGRSGFGGWLKRALMWPVHLTVYALFGEGEMQWLP